MPPDSSSPDRQDVVPDESITLYRCGGCERLAAGRNPSEWCIDTERMEVQEPVEFVPLSRAEEEKQGRERAERAEAGYKAEVEELREARDALIHFLRNAEAEVERLLDVLYSAHEFVATVTAWDGQPADQEETLHDLTAALSPDREDRDG